MTIITTTTVKETVKLNEESQSEHFRWYSLKTCYIINYSSYYLGVEKQWINLSVVPGFYTTNIRLYDKMMKGLPNVIKKENFRKENIEFYNMLLERIHSELNKDGYEITVENIHILKIDPIVSIREIDEEL